MTSNYYVPLHLKLQLPIMVLKGLKLLSIKIGVAPQNMAQTSKSI